MSIRSGFSSLHPLPLMALLFLGSCGYFDSQAAHEAQYSLIGTTSYDLQACAGVPGSTKQLNGTTAIWQYDITRTIPTPQDSTLIPVGSIINIYQAFFGGPGSTCRMIIRLDHDRVSEVHYSGNDDEYIGDDGICSLITRGCARQRESTMRKPAPYWPSGPINAFSSVPTPPQSTSATYSAESGKYIPVFDNDPYLPVIRPAPPPGSTPVPAPTDKAKNGAKTGGSQPAHK
ncbi:hypothetical protein [Oecophyllibacter saccharovorans]|uniref:hypothetical protein n=1 Tax=Oecophyllibacter saccharovorans TaxID=2558360 RepID=UPI00387E2CC3